MDLSIHRKAAQYKAYQGDHHLPVRSRIAIRERFPISIVNKGAMTDPYFAAKTLTWPTQQSMLLSAGRVKAAGGLRMKVFKGGYKA